jgi:anti-sigma B factor antagonist
MGDDEETALEYELIPDGDATTVKLTGEVDLGTLDDLRAAVKAAREAGAQRVLLDFRGVDFIDSTGLSSVMLMHNDAPRAGYELTVVADDGPVRRAFELTGLQHVLAETA